MNQMSGVGCQVCAVRGPLDCGAPPSAVQPEDAHGDSTTYRRDREGEPNPDQADAPGPPGRERYTQQRERRARDLRPQCIARAGERALENDLKRLADLSERDHPEVDRK